jgi:hypothetical protein
MIRWPQMCLSVGLSVRGDIDAIISLAYQPICDAEGQRDRGQAQQLSCVENAGFERVKHAKQEAGYCVPALTNE